MVKINEKGSISALKILLILLVISSLINVYKISIRNTEKTIIRNLIINDKIERQNIYEQIKFNLEKEMIEEIESAILIAEESDEVYRENIINIIAEKNIEDSLDSKYKYRFDAVPDETESFNMEFKREFKFIIEERVDSSVTVEKDHIIIGLSYPEAPFTNGLNEDLVTIERGIRYGEIWQ